MTVRPAASALDPLATPPSPSPRRVRRPRWLDPRLVVGIVLVLASVLLGATLFARASRTTPVWSLAHGLQAGVVLAADDLRPAQVRIADGAGAYLPTSQAVVGRTLTRAVGAGELLPRSAVGSQPGGSATGLVTVTIAFEPDNAPDVARGDRLAVWVSTRTCQAVKVLDDVAVQSASAPAGGLSATNSLDVVVKVSPGLADRVVTALDLDSAVLRAGVLSGPADPAANRDLPSLAGCGAAATGPSPSATPS